MKTKPSRPLDIPFKLGTWLLMLSLSLLTACQTPPLTIHHSMDAAFDLDQYQTFSVHALQQDKPEHIRLINEAIRRVMIYKGYTPAEDADLRIVYDIDVHQSSKLQQETLPQNGQLYSKAKLEAVFEAKMLVNAFAKSTNTVVWKASTTRDLTNANTLKFDQQRANLRMEELFASLPSH